MYTILKDAGKKPAEMPDIWSLLGPPLGFDGWSFPQYAGVKEHDKNIEMARAAGFTDSAGKGPAKIKMRCIMRSRSRSREKKEKTMKAMQVLEKAFEKQPAEEILKALGRFRRYSPANRVLIRFQMPDATLVAGYNAWRKIGRHVKRGEKGIMIIAPVVKKVKSEEEEEEDVVWYRPTYVFDVSQTEGKPVLPSFGERARLEDVEQTIAQSLGAEVREIESGSRQGRVWRDEQGKIVIEVADDDVRTLSFLHEAAHVIAGHLDNPPSTEEEARRYEVVAEGAAFSVLYALGVEAPMNSASHIEMYGRELLREVASEIAEVSDKILDMLRVSDPGLALKEVLEDAS